MPFPILWTKPVDTGYTLFEDTLSYEGFGASPDLNLVGLIRNAPPFYKPPVCIGQSF